MTLPLSSPAIPHQVHDVGTEARSGGEDERRGSSIAHLLSGTPHVCRRVQDSHGVPHALLFLRQGRRHEYSARQRCVHKRTRNVEGACFHDWRHNFYRFCPILGKRKGRFLGGFIGFPSTKSTPCFFWG